jgi:hypothetical protein
MEALMRKFGIATAAVVAVGVAFGGATLASGNGGDGSNNATSRDTFTVYAPTPKDRFVFLPAHSGTTGLGDQFVFSDDLYASKGGELLGHDGGVCTTVRIDGADSSVQCVVTFSLPGGQITTQQLHTVKNGNLTGTQPGAITGGTGKYRGATGEVSVEFLSLTEAYVTFFLD